MKSIYAFSLLFVSHSACQSLITALSGYAQLSQFRDLLKEHPKYVRNVSSTSGPITILAATNDAFINYEVQSGKSIHSLSPALVDDVLLYQTLNQTVQPHDYASSEGFITETWLTDPTYDLRNALDSGAKPGQVAWLSSKNTSMAVRQLSSTFVQSGTGTQVAIEPITGKWDKGTFIAVNGFLTLPLSCTATFDVKGLSSLQTSLTRTNLSDTLNNFPDVVCLAPTNGAFKEAGSPDTNADVNALSSALEFHTIQGPGYTTDFKDGQVIQSINNQSIKVRKDEDGTMYFNDAKVLASNQIVKNGVVHVLDRVMSPLNATTDETSSSSSSASPTSTAPASSASGASVSSTTSGAPSAIPTASKGDAASMTHADSIYGFLIPILGFVMMVRMA